MTQHVPCPLNDQHCATLDRIIETAPQVLDIIADCAECEVDLPGARESLTRSLEIARKLRDKAEKWRKLAGQS
jgi:hypothetical protein